jgi:hypothetical protein
VNTNIIRTLAAVAVGIGGLVGLAGGNVAGADAAGPASSPAAIRDASGVLRVFYRGADGYVHETHLSDTWHDQRIAGAMAAGTTPTVIVQPDGVLRAFYHGTDGTLSHITLSSSGWSYGSLGAVMAPGASPGAVVAGVDRVFYQGADGYVHEAHLSDAWHDQRIAGAMANNTQPSAIVQSDGVMRAFYHDADGSLSHVTLSSSGWSYGSLGPVMAPGASPAAVFAGVDRVFYQGADGYVHETHSSDAWHDQRIAGAMANNTQPSAIVQSDGVMRAFYHGADGTVNHITLSSSGWSYGSLGATMATGSSPGATIATLDRIFYQAPDNNEHVATLNGGWSDFNLGNPMPPVSSGGTGCIPANSCTPKDFADAMLAYSGIDAPITAANEYAIEKWELHEGGGAGCPGQPNNTAPWANSSEGAGNPLNTTRQEPGSTPLPGNSAGVQNYHDSDGQTCWYWGIKANGDALTNGLYGNIIATLRSPSTDPTTQCQRLSGAVVASPWDAGHNGFTNLC